MSDVIKKAAARGAAGVLKEGFGIVTANTRVIDMGVNLGLIPQGIQYAREMYDVALQTLQGSPYAGNIGQDILKGLIIAVPVIGGCRILGKANSLYQGWRK